MLGFYRNTPTLDIYFREPLQDLIASSSMMVRCRRPIVRVGPNTFTCGRKAVIVRYATERELTSLNGTNFETVYYVIDDDLYNLDNDDSLPADYRARLTKFSQSTLPRIVEISDEIVSPSQSILAAFSGKRTTTLSPAHVAVCEDFVHFNSSASVDAIFPGTRSHLADLEAIAPAIERAVQEHDDFTFTSFLGEHGESVLPSHARIVHRRAQSWKRYRQTLSDERFHLALVPYCDTAFNRARSINKLHDVAAFGAAGLYSNRPPSSDVVADGDNGLLLPDDSDTWAQAIDRLMKDRVEMLRLARANAATSARLGDPALVRAFWLKRLPDAASA